jgi:hypothetical protein
MVSGVSLRLPRKGLILRPSLIQTVSLVYIQSLSTSWRHARSRGFAKWYSTLGNVDFNRFL